jgi:hypothetical protein
MSILRTRSSVSSLVLELQQDAMTTESRLTDVLRKALVVATKLNAGECRQWTQKELHGYKPEEVIPEYRHVKGEMKTRDPVKGWIPLTFPDTQTAETVSWKYFTQPVAQIEHLLEKYRAQDLLYIPYPSNGVKQLDAAYVPSGMTPALVVHQSRVYAIVDCVRTLVLEWSLELERENILGNGVCFSKKEKQRASYVRFNLHNIQPSK